MISRAVGEGNQHQKQRYATDSLTLGVLLVVATAALGLLTIEPLFTRLGADADTLPYIIEYMRIWYIGVAFVVIPMIGNNAIRALGDMKTPSLVMSVAALINVVLDPMLIFGFGLIPPMGVAGAAIATVIARAVTLIVALRILIVREKLISFQVKGFSEILQSWKAILFIGLPDALSRMIIPVATGIVTGLVATYGKEAVAAFGIGTRLELFALMVNGAMASVIISFAGQNIGAGQIGRVREGIRFSERFIAGYSLTLAVIFILFGQYFIALFSSNPSVVAHARLYLRIVPLSYVAQGILLIAGSVLIVLKKSVQAAALNLTRLFALYIPLAFVGSHFWGLPGIWVALAVSFLMAAVAARVIMKVNLVKLNGKHP